MKRHIGILALALLGIGLVPTHALAGPATVAKPPMSEMVGNVGITTDQGSGTVGGGASLRTTSIAGQTSVALLASSGCTSGQHTQYSRSSTTGLTLGSHTLRTAYCYTGYAISGTPAITLHTVGTSTYGSSLGVRLVNNGTSGPSKLSSYQWSSTGYVRYSQCVWGTSVCTGGTQHWVMVNPQGSGAYGWAEA